MDAERIRLEAEAGTPKAEAEGPMEAIESYRAYLSYLARILTTGRNQPQERVSDLVQRTMAEAVASIRRGRGPDAANGKVKPWLRSIMIYQHAKAARKTRGPGATQLPSDLIDEATSPSSDAARAERVRHLAAALDRLDERGRRLIDLRHRGLAWREVGDEVGLTSVGAYKAYLRAAARLKEILGAGFDWGAN